MAGESGYESKVTARIDNELYVKVMQHFHHGQQTLLLRKIFDSLEILIDSNEFDKVTDYLYKGNDLTLPGVETNF